MPPRLMPANRGTDAHTEALRRLVSRGSLVDRFNHTHPQICRIWLGHGAFQKPNRPPRLGLSEPLGNPDSIPTETALSRYLSNESELSPPGIRSGFGILRSLKCALAGCAT